jgi:UDP-galactopyranose mutase
MKQILIVGAGFSGAVIARELAERMAARVTVIDRRDHLAGNCHSYRDTVSGVMLHAYGPHVFHTGSERVWRYVNRFAAFNPYTLRPRAVTPRGVFSLPINLLTINQFFGASMSPSAAAQFIAARADHTIGEPRNFEEQALKFIGRELYENFFYGYTKKQWGCEPRELPAEVLKRLPVRFNYNDNYFADRWQGIPLDGYTAVVEKILAHPNISVRPGTGFAPAMRADYDRVFYTGAIDEFFGHQLGRLGYRTVTFERIDADGDYQGAAVLNYTDFGVPCTRVAEHKHFAPWEEHAKTVAFREFSKETGADDEPYYPKNLAADRDLLRRYQELATTSAPDVTFAGRLGTYRYLDMDQTIAAALTVADEFCNQYKI